MSSAPRKSPTWTRFIPATASYPKTRISRKFARLPTSALSALRPNVRLMGEKEQARREMAAAGVPIVPGSNGLVLDAESAAAEGERIGYPLIVKASAGGGGRGMRVVRSREGPDDRLGDRAQRGAAGLRRSRRVHGEIYRAIRGTSNSRCWAIITATSCISASANAASNGGTRSWWKSRPRPAVNRQAPRGMAGAWSKR